MYSTHVIQAFFDLYRPEPPTWLVCLSIWAVVTIMVDASIIGWYVFDDAALAETPIKLCRYFGMAIVWPGVIMWYGGLTLCEMLVDISRNTRWYKLRHK